MLYGGRHRELAKGGRHITLRTMQRKLHNLLGAQDRLAGSRKDGALAQLGEHHVRNVGVESSNLLCSTKDYGDLAFC